MLVLLRTRTIVLMTAIAVAITLTVIAITFRYELFYSDEKRIALAQESYGKAVDRLDSNPEEAERHFSFAMRLDPENFNYGWQLALTQRKLGQYDEAVATFTKVINHKRDEPLIYVHLGETYEELGNFGKAAQSYSAGVRSDANSVQPYIHLALVLNRTGQVDEAVKVLEDGLLKRPDSVEISNLLAFLKNI